MANVFIALPCFGGLMYAACSNGVLELSHVLRDAGHQWSVHYVMGESLIPRARNTLVHKFLKTDCTHLLFIDVDLVFNARDVLGMLAADKDLVGGAYPKKQLDAQAIVDAVERREPDPMAFSANYAINVMPLPADENGNITVTPEAGCVRVLDLPTGFMLVRREVFLDMAAQLLEIEHDSDERTTKGEPTFSWFDCAIEDRRYLSEDYLFSRRCQRMGLEAWLYLPAVLGHIGTHTYRGDLTKVFKPMEPDHSAAIEAFKAGKPLPPGYAVERLPPSEYSLPEANPPEYAKLMVERYEWAAKRIGTGTVADAACGPGYGLEILRKAGLHPIGFDRSAENVATAYSRGYGNIVRCNVEDEDFKDFGALVSIETIEHLKDPAAWLGGVHRHVKKLVVSCPCIPTKHVNEFHLHDFTYDEVIHLVTDLGWTVQEHQMHGHDTIILYATRD